MKRHHKIGFVVIAGKCFVAFYDAVRNCSDMLPALEWKAIEDQECTEAEQSKLTKKWECWARRNN